MLLLLCFALAFAIQGAASQAWTDGSSAARSGWARTRGATKAAVKRGRASDSRAVRWGSGAAQGVGAVLGGGGRLVAGTGRALWTGGKAGWEDGRRRGRRRWARRRMEQRRRQAEQCKVWQEQTGDGHPGWWNYLTGTCPGCGHTTAEAATEIPGCGCRALDWGCACARRRTRRPEPEPQTEPEPEPEPEPGPDLTKHPTPQPVGGDGSAASADPDNPAPTVPPDPVPTPSTTSTGDDMTAAVQEVTTYGQARRAITGFVARATTFLDLADRAEAEADRASDEAAGLEAQAEQMANGLSGNEFDSATIAEVDAMHERASALQAAAAKLKADAIEVRICSDALSGASATALSGITIRHANLDEAHKSAPVRAARREGYEGD